MRSHSFARPSGRKADQLRPVEIKTGVNKYAEGSCLIMMGDTHVLCTASVDERIPPFLRGAGKGWVTAEYGMLPRATDSRNDREAARGKQNGRTQEIQRLIGRSLRAAIDLKALGERQIKVDCDVLQADGGTRCAAITGGYVALHLACSHLQKIRVLDSLPLRTQIAAVSCGLYQDQVVLDLDYREDSAAQSDANFVMSTKGAIVEAQATAEAAPFDKEVFIEMLALAEQGIAQLGKIQNAAILGQSR